MSIERDIFKNGSTTYYWSSKFFPRSVRDDVFKLYSFVRIVDDYVDLPEPDVNSFNHMVERWQSAKNDLANFKALDDSIAERVLQNIAYITYRFKCDPGWVDGFLASMRMDLDKRRYKTLNQTLEYIYGSAEVIGLFMAKILGLPEESYEFAKMQGRAMQYVNFIRDIDEDNELGRQYFPLSELNKHGLKNLSKEEALNNPEAFAAFFKQQYTRYTVWQSEADKGFAYIPKRLRVALQTAVEAYNWTAREIARNPITVFEKQVKPRKRQLIKTGLAKAISV